MSHLGFILKPFQTHLHSVYAGPGGAIIYGYNEGHVYCTHLRLSEEFGSAQLNLSPLLPPEKELRKRLLMGFIPCGFALPAPGE